MAQTYTPGLKVTRNTVIKKERILPLKGEVLVKAGEVVSADTVVAHTKLPGDVEPLNIANKLSIPAEDVEQLMLKKVGDTVQKGEVIAESTNILGKLFKFFNSYVYAPCEGTIESISTVTGQVLLRKPPLPVEIRAYIDGTVVHVLPEEGVAVEAKGSFIQGIFGLGGEVDGIIETVCNARNEVLDESKISEHHKGKVLVGGRIVTYEAMVKAAKLGVAGIISGGINDADLRKFMGYDLGVAITGHENLGITLVVTEGFGEIAMAGATYDLLKENNGKKCSLNGATQIRAGVIRPECIIPLETRLKEELAEEELLGLDIGAPIRVIREPYFGKIGKVSALPEKLQQVESETWVRVLEVEMEETGEKATVPRANVESIQL